MTLCASRVLPGSQGLKRTKWKIAYAQRRRLRRNKFHFQKWSFHDLSASTNPPKKMKASLSKSSSFQIHSSKCSFKTAFYQTSIFKFYLLSTISDLLLPTCSTSSFQKLVEKGERLFLRAFVLSMVNTWLSLFSPYFRKFEKDVLGYSFWWILNQFMWLDSRYLRWGKM